jgi:NADH dehydrogenase
MKTAPIHAVTGAFGYSGKYITQRLLAQGCTVLTLTNSPQRFNPFGEQVEVHPFHFDQPDKMAAALEGVSVLYNTYWVRFNHRQFTHAEAVSNTRILFEAARQAGVERIVHVSITNPRRDLGLEYFSGKAELEQALIDSGMSYAILRPAVLFGKEDILINNIAWALRRFPVFGLFGNGEYGIQPIYVDDLAQLAVEQGQERSNLILNAVGPEAFTYRALVASIGRIIGKPRPLVALPPRLGYLVARAIGWAVGDVFLTWDEIRGLMAGTLAVDTPPTGTTLLSEWASRHAATLGLHYTSELARRRDRVHGYPSN